MARPTDHPNVGESAYDGSGARVRSQRGQKRRDELRAIDRSREIEDFSIHITFVAPSPAVGVAVCCKDSVVELSHRMQKIVFLQAVGIALRYPNQFRLYCRAEGVLGGFEPCATPSSLDPAELPGMLEEYEQYKAHQLARARALVGEVQGEDGNGPGGGQNPGMGVINLSPLGQPDDEGVKDAIEGLMKAFTGPLRKAFTADETPGCYPRRHGSLFVGSRQAHRRAPGFGVHYVQMTFRPWELKNRVILHTLRMPDDHCGDGEELNSNEEEPALSYLQVECLKTQLRGYLRAEPTPEEPTPYQIVSDAARAYLSFPVSARLGHIYACARNALPGVVPSRDVELADETFTEYCWYFADQLDQARIRWAVGLEEVYTSADFLPAYASAMCELRLWKLAIKAADRAGIWR